MTKKYKLLKLLFPIFFILKEIEFETNENLIEQNNYELSINNLEYNKFMKKIVRLK